MLIMHPAKESILFNKAPCGYHYLDAQGFIISINDTLLQWLGYDRSELVNKVKFTDLMEADESLINTTKAGKCDVMLIRKSGEKFPVILSTVDASSSEEGSSPLFSTIDNRRCHEAMERIKNLDQELEAFSYSISHDLRAPLRSIDGYSKILQEDYATQLDEEGRRVLNVVMNNAKRMGKLIDDLLDFGRLGRKTIQRTQINMTSMVKHLLQDILAPEPGREVQVKIGELHPAWADGDMMRQVWFNLLENAIKYTGKKQSSTIEVASYRVGDSEICYEVSDNGVGFDMQYAGKLFGMFQRLHKMQDFSGTGVGLAIVKRIISRHGGRVWATGALNDGAHFYFTLPLEHDSK